MVLALYLPDVAFNFLTLIAVIPFCMSYYRMAKRDEQVSSTTM